MDMGLEVMAPLSQIAAGGLTSLFVLLGLAFLLALSLRPLRALQPWQSTAMLGVAFGLTAVGCMLSPFPITEGTFGDLRNVVIAAAAIIGGPWTAVIAAALASAYRVALGGHFLGGIGTILSAAAYGILVARFWLPRGALPSGWQLALAGVGLAIVNSLWGLLLPNGDRAIFLFQVILVVGLVAYPAALLLMVRFIASEVERLDHVELLERLNARLAALNHDLNAAKDAAERANRTKSEFLANMSHELRTPLNAILGFSELIRDRSLGPTAVERYSDYAGDIHASGRHLLAIIDDLLDLSKIETGNYILYEAETSVKEVIEAAARLVVDRARAKQINLEIEIQRQLPSLYADPRALKQIVLNLLTNAVKFTPELGHVRVSAGLLPDGAIEIRVEDSGRGIPPELVDRLMLPFEQGAPSLTKTQEGAGLGLSIVRRLVDLHQGNFRLESEPGRGTHAIVVLPALRCRPASAA
jgi:signal transduction histidine kinase